MRRFILIIAAATTMAAMAVVTAPPVLGQDIGAGAGETEAAFIDLVPVQACLLDDQGGMVFRVMNQGHVSTAPATTTTVTLSAGGAPFERIYFPTDPIPPGGFVDLALGAGPADLGAQVVGFAITADSTDQVGELDKGNNTVGWVCSDTVGGGPALPSTGGLSPEWLYAMFAAAGVLVSASFVAGIFGLRRIRA
jgi:hypothetical protein